MAEQKQLTVYARIQKVRNLLQASGLKKSGKNKFTGNVYFELGDFEPTLNKLCDEQGIMPLFTLKKDVAVLRVINVDKPEESATFYIPSVAAEVKGALAIQNLGAQVTYLRRYLLMIAFEIAESDIQDALPEGEQATEKQLDPKDVAKINGAKTHEQLVKVCGELKKKVGNDLQKTLLNEYTRRKSEIEMEAKEESDVPEIPTGEEPVK